MTLLSPVELDTHATIGRLGPEPLARGFDAPALAAALHGRNATTSVFEVAA